ncbi:hypothetical protein AWC38_SpisGene20324 [Stylophora pistillata]|uniref:Uncharacterized protein n=1 Tax=Stylophora pistillata TaxID=50429 RepID=A0A2B4RCS5_STYPI|nr:hypothetical protein AWC38_SpisGene20324 [Stylophora pistillata]
MKIIQDVNLAQNDKQIVPKPPSYEEEFPDELPPEYDEDEVPDYEIDDEDIRKDLFKELDILDYENVEKVIKKKQMDSETEKNFLGSERYETSKNGRILLKCTCSEFGISKTKFVKQQGSGIISSAANTALEGFIQHGIPWMGRKLANTGRYYASEAMRDKRLQKKVIDYGMKKLSPIIRNVGSPVLDQLSTKVRPKKNYVRNRKDLDGGSLIDYSQWYPMEMYSPQGIHDPTNPLYKGGKIDIHKVIGKLPRPKAGWTPGKYNYLGRYNPLEKQLEYDKNTGEVLKWNVQRRNKVDEIAAYHDICYDMVKDKGDCDRQMVEQLNEIPYGQMPKMSQVARTVINK